MTFIGEKFVELKDKPIPGLLGEGTKADGVKD